jgi:hypothetical protein
MPSYITPLLNFASPCTIAKSDKQSKSSSSITHVEHHNANCLICGSFVHMTRVSLYLLYIMSVSYTNKFCL